MFEQRLEDCVVSFHVDHTEAALCRAYGMALHAGAQDMTYPQAVALLKQGDAVWPSVAPSHRPRFLALVCRLRNAFGPACWQRYPSPEHLEDIARKAFPPHDHRGA